MSLIICPECRVKISEKAITCPQCGFPLDTEQNLLPINLSENNHIIPMFKYDLKELDFSDDIYEIVSIDDNKNILEEFGKWEKIKNETPAIAEIINDMAHKEEVLVARMDDYVKKLIDKGVYRFSIDANGDILPTIRNGKEIVKQIRLEKQNLSPEINDSINNLALQATMNKIIDEIESLNYAIKGIHIELQNDRIALAESAIDKMNQALKIKDIKLKEIAIINAISTATDAKRTLIRNFSQALNDSIIDSNKSEFKMMLENIKSNDASNKANEAFQSLVIITNMVKLECKGYSILGEVDAASETLKQFEKFILNNKLDNKNTLIILNGSTIKNKSKVAEEFYDITKKIKKFNTIMIENKKNGLLEENK